MSYFVAICCSTFMLTATIWGVQSYPLQENERLNRSCIWLAGFKTGHCELLKNCQSMQQYIDMKIIGPSEFFSCWDTHMICCPDEDSEKPEEHPYDEESVTKSGTEVTHLANLVYLSSSFDDYVSHCTAIVLSPTTLLASAMCFGDVAYKNPTRAVVGATDTRQSYDEDLEYSIQQNFETLNKDLNLLKVRRPIAMKNVTTATFCLEHELRGQPKLYAIGFAVGFDEYTDSETNCGLFKAPVEINEDCTDVQSVALDRSHMCVKDLSQAPSDKDECTNCLAASTSVLHVEREDGSLCVAGIATPTQTAPTCDVSSGAVAYTILTSDGIIAGLKY